MADKNIKDVAMLAGVSAMTVTRTLKNPELVKEETRQRVMEAIRALDYIPNRTASALRSSRSNTVGIALYDIENPFMSKLVMHLEKSLKAREYITLVSFVNEEEVDDYDIYARLKSFNVDLSIFIPTQYSTAIAKLSPAASSKYLQLFRQCYSGIDSLTVDDIYGAYLGTKHLLENGHERILLVDFDQRLPMYRDRGYVQAFQEMGRVCDEAMILKVPEFLDGSHAGLIRDAIIKTKPTAILAVTQKLCEASISAFTELGLRIYDDISLVGYDDTVLAQYLGITTIAHPFDEMIEKIADWAALKISDTGTGDVSHIQVKPFLNIRTSVKNLNA